MKQSLLALTLSLSLALGTTAGPITKQQVPPDASWVAHLDLDRVQESELGKALIRSFIEPRAKELSAAMNQLLGIPLDLHKLHSVTAYGRKGGPEPVADAVLLIQSDLPVQAAIQTALTKLKGNPEAAKQIPLQRLETDGFELFSLQGEGFLALPASNLVVLGKSKAAVSQAVSQLKTPSAKPGDSKLVANSPGGEKSLVWLAATGAVTDGLELPPQAALLKQTEGVRLSLSESTDNLLAHLTLKTKTVEVVEQLHQALQGILTLATLGTAEDARMQGFLKGIRIERRQQDVEVGLRFPLAELSKWMDAAAKPQRAAQR